MKRSVILLIIFIAACPAGLWAEEEPWKEYRAKHFIIYYQDTPFDFIESVEQMAELFYDEVTDNLGFRRYEGWNWDDRAKIYIYNDRDHYLESRRVIRWSHGVASPKDKVIRSFPSDSGFFDTLLPHELGHIIFREFIGFRARVPLWFEEGVATNQEKARRYGADRTVRKAIESEKFIPLDELSRVRLTSSSSPALVDLFYAESASIVNYLINEHGKHRFSRLCRELEEGTSFENAMKKIYVRYRDLDKLNRDWVDYLKRK